ncbi:hypothetical protein CI238_02985 [Colletotrichum incanum]|uniref:Uncharacterized protein n=1 Tax=Colletotrichum incanum TaxID=1573173 RepID=A0A167EI07_COLIC|nr:hypothetical protein CI238_02985 [Colletotrichum incanum]
MIDDFDSYDMNDIKSPLDRLPSLIRHPSFFGDTPLSFPSTETNGKSKQKGPDGGGGGSGKSTTTEKADGDTRARKDSVMTGVEGSTSGSSSVSVSSILSCRRPAVTVRKRVLDVDEKGESSRSAQEVLRAYGDDRNKEKDKGKDKGEGSVDNDFGDIWLSRPVPPGSNAPAPKNALQLALKPSTVAPRRSRFVEGLEGVRTEAVGRTSAEVRQRISLPGPARTAAEGVDLIKQYFPPAVTQQKEPQAALGKDTLAPATPSSEWCHHDGGCLQRKGRRRRNLARAVVRLAKKPIRWNREDKGKKRAACEICGDDTRLDLRDWRRDKDARESKGDSSVATDVAEMLSQLYDGDEAESSRRCSVCGQKVDEGLVWERDEDSPGERSEGTTLGSKDDPIDSSSKAAVGRTEIPEAWWTRRFRL